MVYLIENIKSKAYKIGYSNNPYKRLSSLQTSTPDELALIFSVDGDYKLEKQLHKEFNHLHLNREWFKRDSSIFDKFNVLSGKIKYSMDEEPFIFLNNEFWNMVICSNLKKTDIELFCFLLKDYNNGKCFTITDYTKQALSDRTGKSKISYNNSARNLIKEKFIESDGGKKLFKINKIFTPYNLKL